jgi:hypothetical protein
LDKTRIGKLPHANGRDQAEAKAMNTALWPATLGYFMEELTGDMFTDADRDFVKDYFANWVSGRGPIPALRIGTQPYGILPIAPFRKLQFSRDPKAGGGLTHVGGISTDSIQRQRLHGFLGKLEAYWDTMSGTVSHVGKDGNPQQVLMDVLGLHHGSVEYHQRYSETMMQLYNTLKLQGSELLAGFLVSLIATATKKMGTELGIPEDQLAMKILEIFHKTTQDKLVGDVVDSQELSEENPVEEYATGMNYLDWLATSSLDTIRKMNFGAGVKSPTALLFLFLRHAMMLSHHETSVKILAKADLIDPKKVKIPVDFIHIEQGKSLEKTVSGASKFEPLYAKAPAFTNHADKSIAEYLAVPGVIKNLAEAAELNKLRDAVEFLADTPTARLERLFAEHVDTVSYRLDAWKTAMVAEHIARKRGKQHTQGIQVGSYAFLENVKPENKNLSPVRLTDPSLLKDFGQMGRIVKDSENGGYIHAPSLNHATTSAILKNAYEENASSGSNNIMAVNISSERVRNALTVLEGIRNGQSLGALLGYRFERGLHDAHNLAEVDKFIYPLRKKFSQVTDKLSTTLTDASVPVRLLGARNVLDGVRFAEHIRTHSATYPFGLPTGTGTNDLPSANPAETKAINAEVNKMLDLNDAVADLVMAENIYQVVRGNFEKAAAISQAFSEGKYPHEPEVVQTPRTGTGLTHRAALHLDPNAASPNANPLTPRATAEPALHAWICNILPSPDDIVAQVSYTHPALAVAQTTTVSLTQIGLQPLDLFYTFNLEMDQAMASLDDRILQFVRYDASLDPHPGLKIEIQYTTPVAGKASFFEVASLVRSLRDLVLHARPLGAEDLALTQTATSADINYDLNEFGQRVKDAIAALDLLRAQLEVLETDASDIDAFVAAVSTVLLKVSEYGVPGAGTANLHEGIRSIHAALVAKMQDLVTRWQAKALEYDALMAGYAALTTDDERFALLLQAEGKVMSSTTSVLPATTAAFKLSVEASKVLFDAALLAFQAQASTSASTLTAFLAAVSALLPTAALHDAVPLSLETELGDGTAEKPGTVAKHRALVLAQVTALADDLVARKEAADALVDQAAASTESNAVIRLLTEAAKQVLGSEIKLLPRFSLSSTQAAEVSVALGSTGSLTNYLTTTKGRRFPVDDWFYGMARVRKKFSDWENIRVLAEAFGGSPSQLQPLQFPYSPGDHWLALDIPDTYVHSGEHLLYTAEFPVGYDPATVQCGLLLDEWSEVIPSKEETTGIVFHYDTPNQEPPQAWLLVTPASLSATWTWDELLDGREQCPRRSQSPCRGARPDRQDPRGPIPSGHPDGGDTLPDHHCHQFTAKQSALYPPQSLSTMQGKYLVPDIQAALKELAHPSTVLWNRLEGRPRNPEFSRALKAEVRDALWMLSRQWQLGEFQGDDAGSPVKVKVHTQLGRLDKFQAADNPVEALPTDVPIESRVEQMPLQWEWAGKAMRLDLRLQVAQYWNKLLSAVGLQAYKSAYLALFPITLPAEDRTNAYLYAHRAVHQQFAAVAGRSMDGGNFLAQLQTLPASTGIVVSDPAHTAQLDALGEELKTWFSSIYQQPGEDGANAWIPEKLEYQFKVAGTIENQEKVLAAEEYYHGHLDWHSLDIDNSGATFEIDAELSSSSEASVDPHDSNAKLSSAALTLRPHREHDDSLPRGI